MEFQYQQEAYMTPNGNNGQMTPGISPQGMIEVPDDIRRMNAQISQQTYQVPQQLRYQNRGQQVQNGWPANGYFGKMMVGSLAGLMILEGFSQPDEDGEEPAARGLFALPVEVLRSISRTLHSSNGFSALGYHTSSTQALGALKVMLLFGVVLYIFIPSFFTSKSKSSSNKTQSTSLAAAPSLASSIQVRRQAWLTAIQTVWVPRHNFFLEATALCLKMVKLSLRNAIGWYGYAILTGITEQQEAARIKAWTIALDAQLGGGDVEISKSRLTLTLLASGTLPDTPSRLMLKALHLRVLLWELGNAGFNGYYMFHEVAAKLAQWKWDAARQLQKVQAHSLSQLQQAEIETLPDHLSALLEQECDDVLADSIGQRAYNLAWNLPTSHNVIGGQSGGMDAVVVDFAIRSPLDAVAAWYSSRVLETALAASLSGKEADDAEIISNLELAIKTAPVGSGAQIRALVSRAVLLDEMRGANIAAALQVLDLKEIPKNDKGAISTLVNTTTSLISLPDLRMSLNCAMAIAHLKRLPPPSSPVAAYDIINSMRPTKLSLLGFTAAFKLMQVIFEHEQATAMCSRTLESMAGALRRWVGGKEGMQSGLEKKTREEIVEVCLMVAKKMVGMERDEGFESMDEDGDDGC
jgi:hypothetical protein